jgi:hypothetical protein
MGLPVEIRTLLIHLLNISDPYSFENPVWALIGQGVSELTEDLGAEDETIQYINEATASTMIRRYAPTFDIEMSYTKNLPLQKYFNKLVRLTPTGQNAMSDYVRFNLDEPVEGQTNQFLAVRRRASVYPSEVGGASEDYLSTTITVGGLGDGIQGVVTVDSAAVPSIFVFSPSGTIPPEVTPPVILGPQNGATVGLQPAIYGTGIPDATVKVNDGANDILTVIVAKNGSWGGTPTTAFSAGGVTITATQTTSAGISQPTAPITFTAAA